MQREKRIATGSGRWLISIGLALAALGPAPQMQASPVRSDLRAVPVRSFGPSDYGAHPQCWSMVQDPRGLVHVANTEGLLTFDGARWTRWAMENDAAVTSVCVGPDGNVYVGATGHMARLVADEQGRLEFEVLGQELASEDRPLGDIWFSVSGPNEVYMCSLTQIYRVGVDGSVERIDGKAGLELDGRYFAPEVWRGSLWIVIDGDGLFRWSGEHFQAVARRDPTAELYDTTQPFSLYNLSDVCVTDDYFVIIETDQLYRFDGENVARFTTEADSLFAKSWPYAGTGLADGSVGIGTVEAGAFVIDMNGKILGHWNAAHGLLQDTVSDLGTDDEGGLWVCQEAGVVRLDLDAPIEIFPEVTGLISDVLEVDERVYVTTSHGFYRLAKSDGDERRFEVLRKGDDFTGMLSTADGFFVVSSAGVRRWNGTAFEKKHLSLNYPSTPIESRHHEQVLFCNSRDGLVAISTEGDTLRAISTTALPIEGYTLTEGRRGELWVGSREGVVLRVSFDSDRLSDASVEVFGRENGVPASYCAVSELGGKIYLGTGKGLFQLEGDQFVAIPGPGEHPAKIDEIRRHGEDLWALADGNVGKVRLATSAPAAWSLDRSFSLHERSGRVFSFGVLASTVWAAQADRLVRWQTDSQRDDRQSFAPMLRRVAANGDSTIWSGTSAPEALHVDYAHNSVRFEFAAATQRGESSPTYQSMLEGHDDAWSDWSPIPFRDYSNLREGSYVFRLRAMDGYGAVSSQLDLQLQVAPPWTRTVWARAFFLLLLSSGIALISMSVIHIRSRQLEMQKKALQLMVEASTEELALANLDLHASNIELEHVNAELRRVDSQRSELLGIAAHDLKNPLSSIRMVANTLAEDMDPESESGQLFALINEASERMLERIQGLLSSAAAEAGEMRIEFQECEATALGRDVIELQRPAALAKEQSLTLKFDPADADAIWLRGDHGRLHQAFENLVSNAIKYSPHGAEIVASVQRIGEEQVRFQVADCGPGLDNADLERLFRPFQRLTPRPTADEESCGLGLYIVKNVVEHHDGRVWVQSELGRGSTFGFDLPVRAHATV